MTYHRRIDVNRENFGTGSARVPNLKKALDEERRVHRTSPKDSYNERMAAANIEDLEKLLGWAEENEEIRQRNQRERETKRENERVAREKADANALEADLRERFRRQISGGSEADLAALRPALLAQIAEERRADDEAARARMRARMSL